MTDSATTRRGGLLWLLAALLLSLSVLAINRVPLYYFDSAGYKLQGASILRAVLPKEAPKVAPAGSAVAAGGGAKEGDDQVNVTRSPTYALLVALGWKTGAPYALAFLNLVAVFAAAGLAVRAAARASAGARADLTLLSAPIAVAGLTALPFYVAYVMPDTFAAVAILVMATIVAFSRRMTRWELLFALALLALSVVVHRSHLMIVGLAVPVAALAMLLTARRQLWIVAGLILAAAVVGVGEIGAYSVAAEKVSGKTPSFRPFITARLVADGPGYDYLKTHCPDAEIPSCPLAEALARSDNPHRLSPENILFERSEELGSFRLLSPEDQLSVARDQERFFFRVLTADPLGVVGALIHNTLRQAGLSGIEMTIPDANSIDFLQRALENPSLDVGRLAADRSWIGPVNVVHSAIYLAAVAVILGLFVVPGYASRETRIFAVFVVIGILINAFVCGAVSQPAPRYGARVIWLLPYLATMMTILALRRRSELPSGEPA